MFDIVHLCHDVLHPHHPSIHAFCVYHVLLDHNPVAELLLEPEAVMNYCNGLHLNSFPSPEGKIH